MEVLSLVISGIALAVSIVLFLISRNDANQALKITYLLPVLSKICERNIDFVLKFNNSQTPKPERLKEINDFISFLTKYQIVLGAIGVGNDLKNLNSALILEDEEDRNKKVVFYVGEIVTVCQKKYTKLIHM